MVLPPLLLLLLLLTAIYLVSRLPAQVMEGANVEVDESAEERKGGAGDLGKVGVSRKCAAAQSLHVHH